MADDDKPQERYGRFTDGPFSPEETPESRWLEDYLKQRDDEPADDWQSPRQPWVSHEFQNGN